MAGKVFATVGFSVRLIRGMLVEPNEAACSVGRPPYGTVAAAVAPRVGGAGYAEEEMGEVRWPVGDVLHCEVAPGRVG